MVILPARFLLLHRAFPRHEVSEGSEGRGCAQDVYGPQETEKADLRSEFYIVLRFKPALIEVLYRY